MILNFFPFLVIGIPENVLHLFTSMICDWDSLTRLRIASG